MPISIVTRAYKTSELKNLISNLHTNLEVEKEIIAVCRINDHDIKGINLIIENSNMFQARITGIKNANYDRILLLDSDQIPEKGLLHELDDKSEDMVIIPEKSINKNFTSKCLDDWRYRNEKYAMENPNPYIPVVPRYYRRSVLLNVINELSPDIYKIESHEDSILYYEVFKETQNIGFAKKYILNYDPPLKILMQKAFLYGKYRKILQNLEAPDDILMLINKINKNALNIKDLGIGRGYIIQILRGLMYELGRIIK
ncbi:hypothetical protein SE19_04370 [Acidiplasma aeolicum]|uniref:Glycosyltransferase 2-like domain-containing protein n=2 Tax=Acidiplasma aeolicum TaxID=507754 RepID=A0A0P9GYU8_9ARCH|nr:hypothetical protein [Acidiplasma aeolicum]KPV46714.1 hypothetical protein SE19_04370 [Acidiplasma aeolicum]